VALLPENPEFRPILVAEGDESFVIEGVAVGLVRPQFLS